MDQNTDNKSMDLEGGESIKIPVIHEQVEIGKKVIETGRVRVTKTVSEDEEFIDVPLMHEEIDVNRVTVNQYIGADSPQVRYEGDTMIIPIIKEVVVVEKRLMLVEEIHVTRRKVETHHLQNVTLRKEEVNVERTGASDTIQND